MPGVGQLDEELGHISGLDLREGAGVGGVKQGLEGGQERLSYHRLVVSASWLHARYQVITISAVNTASKYLN